MLPPALTSALYAATIVGATSVLARFAPDNYLGWVMYVYLVGYRTKMFLDDLVHYEDLKGHALTRYEPALAIISWVLWIAAAIRLDNANVYFILIGANFLLCILWVVIADSKVNSAMSSGLITSDVAGGIRRAHRRFVLFNLPPVLVGLGYGIALSAGVDAGRALLSLWLMFVLFVFFLWDVKTDWNYMFRLAMFVRDVGPPPPMESRPNADAGRTLASESTETNVAEGEENRRLLVQQWQTVVQYWASDNSVVLRWSSIFIVVNSILFALLAIAPSDSIVPTWMVTKVGPILGVLMNAIWFIVAARFVAYLKFYYDLARDIQRKVPILQFPDSSLLTFRWYQKMSTKKMALLLPLAFAAVWASLLIVLSI
jgi:hypothetical protein